MLHRFSKWVFQLDRPTKRAIQVMADMFLIVGCFILAMGLRYDDWSFLTGPRVWDVLIFVVPVTLLAFVHAGLYRAVIRFISSRAIKAIVISIMISGATMMIANLALGHLIPRSVPFIFAVLLFCATAGTRFVVSGITHSISKKPKENVVIYGAGDAGRQLLNALISEGEYKVIAFVDDDPSMQGREVDTIKIRSPDDLGDIKQRHDVNAVLIAAPSAGLLQRRRIISMVESHALQLRTIPSMGDIVSGKAHVADLTDIQIEDLLAREVVVPRQDLIARNISGKAVMVTGAGGSIGGELCRQIVKHHPLSILLYEISEFALYQIHDELSETIRAEGLDIKIFPLLGSVQSAARLRNIFRSFKVETIYHAAAYKHVPLVEHNIIEGLQNNIFGTETLVRAAIDAGVGTLTLISTDKAVRPTNFMGASKRIAEVVCQAYAAEQTGTCISIVRFGNVLWSSGSVLPRFKEQIQAGGPVTVTHPAVTRYFMTIPEAAQLVMQASAMSKGGEVFVLDMGEPVCILDLAKSMIRLHGLVPYLENEMRSQEDDICITFSGLRPGEKMHEELLVGSSVSGTDHPLIMCADETIPSLPEIKALLGQLREACDNADVMEVNRIINGIAIGFKPIGAVVDLTIQQHSQSMPASRSQDKVVDIQKELKRK